MDALSPAGRWARLAAWLIDLPLSPASFVAAMLLADAEVAGAATLVFLALGVVGAPAQAILLKREGQTYGKRLLRIRIVDEDTGVKPTALKTVGLRYFVTWLLSLIPPYALIDGAFILAKNRKCLHDYIAGTKVVVDMPRS